jgi:hypothetical protein
MNKSYKTTLLLSLMLLSGCTYGSQFDCPVGEGNKCTSLSETVKKIEADQLNLGPSSPAAEKFYFREDF